MGRSLETAQDFSKQLHRLLLLYKLFVHLLDSFFSGYLLIGDDEINRSYLRLCARIDEILSKPGFEKLVQLEWRPFENLRALDPDAPEVEWEYGGQQLCANFLSSIEEMFVRTGEKAFQPEPEDQRLISGTHTYLQAYRSYKQQYESKWLQRAERKGKEWQEKQVKGSQQLPEFDFRFVGDEEIRGMLTKDWQEVRKASANKLHKSTVVLCGTITESLLIDALSQVQSEAETRFRQTFIDGKTNRSGMPEIEAWKMRQLIEVAKDLGIIRSDAAKLSHVVRNYRNLVHLYAQKREQLQVNEHTAGAVIHFLAIAYSNISEWHQKRKHAEQF